MQFSSYDRASKIIEALHCWPDRGLIKTQLKHQLATSTTAVVENFETELLGMLTLMDADSLACFCGILGLDVPEQKKDNLKLLLIYVLRQLRRYRG